jgi:copper homeostasis protein
MSVILELAAFNLDAIDLAAELSIPRVELCENYAAGGVSPSLDVVVVARKKYAGELVVMIRPRGGNFVYTEEEVEQMSSSIQQFKQYGVNGFVVGTLTADNKIDEAQLIRLIKEASPLPVTFHRAIDEVSDYELSIQLLIQLGVKRVLTTAQFPSAYEGRRRLKEVQLKFGNQLQIIAGGGIRSSNAKEIIEESNVNAIHTAAIMHQGKLPDREELERIFAIVK